MNKKTRDWLFRIFVFLFVVITTLLSLYATGYRFNLSWPMRFDRLLIKTGTLALNTSPKNALVTITSETKISSGLHFFNFDQKKFTPIKIKNLLPGEYTISFTLDGYWPYQKKLRVNPEQTTFLEDVIMFKKSLPLNVTLTSAQKISYSPSGVYAYLEDDKKIINLNTEEVIVKDINEKINWSENDKQVSKSSSIINLEDSSLISNYTPLIGQAKESQVNSDLLIYLIDNRLSLLDLKTKTTSLIATEGKILSYQISGDNLFLVTQQAEQTEIKNFNLKSKTFTATATLLKAQDFSFHYDSKGIILSDNEHHIAYIINPETKIIKDVIRGASVFKWIDNNKLAYASESEIYLYDLSQSKSYLIIRLGEKINSLAWSVDNYLVYATSKTIGTINLSDEGNDIMIIWQGDDISSLNLNNKTGVLHFSGKIGNQSGLYKMILK